MPHPSQNKLLKRKEKNIKSAKTNAPISQTSSELLKVTIQTYQMGFKTVTYKTVEVFSSGKCFICFISDVTQMLTCIFVCLIVNIFVYSFLNRRGIVLLPAEMLLMISSTASKSISFYSS